MIKTLVKIIVKGSVFVATTFYLAGESSTDYSEDYSVSVSRACQLELLFSIHQVEDSDSLEL